MKGFSKIARRFSKLASDPRSDGLRADYNGRKHVGSNWCLCGGPPSFVIEQFRALAAKASVLLPEVERESLDAWLDFLRETFPDAWRWGPVGYESGEGLERQPVYIGTLTNIAECSATAVQLLEGRESRCTVDHADEVHIGGSGSVENAVPKDFQFGPVPREGGESKVVLAAWAGIRGKRPDRQLNDRHKKTLFIESLSRTEHRLWFRNQNDEAHANAKAIAASRK